MKELCEPYYPIIAAILILLFVFGGKEVRSLLAQILRKFLGKETEVTVNVMEGEMPKEKPTVGTLCPFNGQKCGDHALVMGFITDTKIDRDRIYKKVNITNIKVARIETMMTVLLKARGLKVDLGAMDSEEEED